MERLTTFSEFLNETFLNEIGEVRNPYKWTLISGSETHTQISEAKYRFTSKSGVDYVVTIERPSTFMIVIDFGIEKDGIIDKESVSNEGDPLTIFSTVFSILKAFVSKNLEIEVISYNPVSNFKGDERREKIYMEYMRKNFDIKKTWKHGSVMVKIK